MPEDSKALSLRVVESNKADINKGEDLWPLENQS